MAEAVKDLQHVLDLVADQLMTVPYWLTISGLCAICSTLADDVRDRYLLHFWVRCAGLDARFCRVPRVPAVCTYYLRGARRATVACC